jgi:hypothetical protein
VAATIPVLIQSFTLDGQGFWEAKPAPPGGAQRVSRIHLRRAQTNKPNE